MTHTPGPWSLKEDKQGGWEIVSAEGDAFMGDKSYYPWQSENIDDVRLIAASPDLLEALKEIVEPRQCGCSPVCQCNAAESLSIHLEFIRDIAVLAIAKAEGK